MKELFDYITGYARLRADSPDGTDKTAVLADKLAQSIKFKGLSTSKGSLYVTVRKSDEKYATELAGSVGMTAKVVSKHGMGYFFQRYSKRIGIPIGAAIAIVIILFLSNIVLSIEISGNETITDDEIMTMLSDTGITYGTFIPSVNFRKAEKELLISSDKIAWASLRRSGFRVIAEISEMSEVPRVYSKNQPSNIVSMYDAQITSIKVYSGMLMPMMGDTVRSGEILISGVVSKKFEGTYNVRAMGEIRGQYRKEVSFTQPYEDTVKLAGESFSNRYLKIFGKSFSLPGNEKLPEKYEFTRDTEYVDFLSLTLPVAVTTVDIMPFTEENITYSQGQAEELIAEKISDYEKNFLTDGDIEVIEKSVERTADETAVTVTVSYLLEGNIGIEKPFFPIKE
ncbi:MAG: sporulation protein YqfD [Oscillospiraceae bacterium]|nr:sporulation protein YqfD [Oscillospiraceae bacterium]